MAARPGAADRPLPLIEAGPEPAAETPHYAGHRQRLRQKFLAAGPVGFADYELLELLLFGAIPRQDVKPLAKQLLQQFGSLGGVIAADPVQLERRAGLGPAAVVALKATGAVAERMLRETVLDRPVLGAWQQLLDYLQVAMKFEQREQFRLLFLDRRNALIADEVQQRGTIDHAPVYPREVVRRALELSASALIMVHNHPSGDPKPSRADIEMTREVMKAAATVGIVLHDHLVIGRKGHASFKAIGLI